jgi:hypothetical protein
MKIRYKEHVKFENMQQDEEETTPPIQTSSNVDSPKKKNWQFLIIIGVQLIIIFLLLGKWLTASNHIIDINTTQDIKTLEQDHDNLGYSDEVRKAKEEKAKLDTAAALRKHSISTLRLDGDRPLILYSHYETPSSRANAIFFIQHGLHAGADFIFILNGDSNLDELLPSDTPNIRVVKKSNACFDLGSHGYVLNANKQELVKKYKRFILMNSSVRGPFLPTWAHDGCWSDIFLNKLTDKVKLVGMTYNCWADHVQSMVIATDLTGIKILLAGNDTDTTYETDAQYSYAAGNPTSLAGLSRCPETKFRAVSTEISLTQLIKRNNYEFAVLMTAKTASKNYTITCLDWDNDLNGYNLRSLHPYETIFIKARDKWEHSMDLVLLRKMSEWHDEWDYSSWEACKK